MCRMELTLEDQARVELEARRRVKDRVRRAERYHDMPGGPMILCGGCRLYFMYPEGAPERAWPVDRWDMIECPRCRVVGGCEPVV